MMLAIPIGELARRAGVKIPTIRYYESIGVLPEPPRTDANRRVYGDDAVQRLQFIKHARKLGFEIDAIRQLLALQDDPHQSCDAADAIARSHLSEVEKRLRSLRALKRELQRMIVSCGQGRIADCLIIQSLNDHEKCEHHG